ncbi:MAG: hypothetical protein Q7J98_01715 [Kiritimatiellia bacterium]|nr:hypothetical protein [Kiritimatiellia bacterium]
MSGKLLIYNDDGWSSYMRYPAPMSPEEVVRVTVGPVIGTAVKVYQFCALGGHAVNYNSAFLPRVGEMMAKVDTMHVWRMRATLRHLEKLGTDPLHIVSKTCHEHGIKCQFSLRMNDKHHTYKKSDGAWYFPELLSPWIDAHPELLLPDRSLDYTHPAIHEYRKRKIREILDNYDVDGIDLDFTRFKPWFREGQEKAGTPLMTKLVQQLREMTKKAGKTLSARFEYDPQMCIASGLDVERWLHAGLLDQITLGGIGDHTPDAAADWWIERAHIRACKVYPGMEGQLHWVPGCGGGGSGIHPANDGVADGFGPPSIEYMRAVAANHYRSGADGVSLFNFTCADGPFSRDAFTELADPAGLKFKDKQYVAAVWPWDTAIYYHDWTSRFRIAAGEALASYTLRIADDIEQANACGRLPCGILTLDLKGVNRLSDVVITMNGTVLQWNGYLYNHYDHGCWNDIVQFVAPPSALKCGDNIVGLQRQNENPGFTGAVEVRKCILELQYPNTFIPGRITS